MRLHTNLQVKVIKMTQCIICRKDTKELSEQYVIPEILCGYYFTNSNALIMKLCKKHDISLHNEIWKEERVTKVASSIQRELLLDNRKYKMSVLKMAYTFAVQAVDGYFEDPDAIDISNILSNADFMELKEKSIVRDLSKSSLWNTLNTNSENHYFILLSDKDGLFCFIRLFDIFDVVVHLSEKRYELPSPIVGVNNVNEQKFYVQTLKQYMDGLFKEKAPSI